MPYFLQDLSHAARSLRKRPGFALATMLTLAVGIGANVTVFSIVNAMVFRPLPFGDRSDRVVTLQSTHRLQAEDPGWGRSALSYPDFLDLGAAGSFDGLGGYLARNFTLTGGDSAERVQGGSVTPELFGVLGVQPMLGRTFHAEEAAPPGLESSVILTHGLWQRRYGADTGIIGRTIVVNDRARTVVGVMPPQFKFPERDEIYVPLRWDDAPRSARNLNVVGLLRRDVTRDQAQRELDALAARLAEVYPETNRGYGVRLLPLRDALVGPEERGLSAVLMAAVGFVLLIVCANLSNLLLVRGAARQREAAVRAAIGASRWRLMSSLLAESLLLSGVGAAIGLLASQWVLDFIRLSFPEELPYWMRFDVDVRVASFAIGIAVFTALVTGLLPALRASRPKLHEDLKESGRGISLGTAAQRLQSGLAVLQVALCLTLLIGASLMIRSFVAMQDADLGFDHRPVLSARAYLAGDAYDDVRARAAFFASAVDELERLPGVVSAAATTSIPGDDGGALVRLVVDGQTTPEQDLAASSVGATPGIFRTLGVTMIEGRPFTAMESADPHSEAVIINAALARRLWPGESALERRIGVRGRAQVTWFRIVGVAPDVHYEEIGEETESSQLNLYLPYARSGARTMALLVRGSSDAATLIMPVRDALRQLHAGLPLYEIMPMTERRRFTTWEQEFFGQMMGVFAGIALLLACLGVYALLSYSTGRRTQEIGVRLALGASPRDVIRLFVGQAGVVGGLGLLVGVALAAIVSRALGGLLWGVDPLDPRLFAAVGAVLLAVVLFASYWPARRAAHLDPVTALRAE